jgi:hypothetical protein
LTHRSGVAAEAAWFCRSGTGRAMSDVTRLGWVVHEAATRGGEERRVARLCGAGELCSAHPCRIPTLGSTCSSRGPPKPMALHPSPASVKPQMAAAARQA